MSKVFVFVMLFSAVGLLFFGIGSTVAGGPERSCELKFEKYDIDGDRAVSPEEFKMTYDEGQYMGTVPTPGHKTPAFIEFSWLDREDKGYLTLANLCAGERY